MLAAPYWNDKLSDILESGHSGPALLVSLKATF